MKEQLKVTLHLPIDSYLLCLILKAFESEEDAGNRVYLKQMGENIGIFLEKSE